MNYSSMEEILLTQELIRIESTNPGTYEAALAEFVYEWLVKTGAEMIREPVTETRYNIIAKLKGKVSSPNLVYICHMDTVPLGEGWTVDPLGAEIIDDKIYGRGSCDMKAGLAAGMLAFRNISQNKTDLAYDFLYILTVDEEDVMLGAEQVIKDGYVNADSFVLDSEPTNSLIQVAHKGKTWFSLTAHGLASHASTAQKGCDAVAGMSEIICSIKKRLASLPLHEEMGPCTAVFGIIKGGININIVPDKCSACIDMRLVPPTTNKQSIDLVEAAIAEGISKVPGLTCDYIALAQRPAVEKDDQSYLLTCLKKTTSMVNGQEAIVDFFPGYTDSAVVAAVTGNRNCMSYGPGDLGRAHKPDEFVPCEDIIRCTKVMTELAKLILIPQDKDTL